MHQATAFRTSEIVDSPEGRGPMKSARTAEAVTDTGWLCAKACSQPGIASTGTKADEAKTSGAITGNAAACAASGFPTASPSEAKIQENVYPNRSTSPMPARNSKRD